MIHIRTASFDDIADIEQILEENNLKPEEIENYLLNCMIALDNHIPVAAAGFVGDGNIALIQFVVVKKTRQGEYIGDAILKALLNLAETKGVREVFIVTKNKWDVFFKKVGFEEVEPEQIDIDVERLHIQLKGENDVLMHVTLPDFFKNACKSKRHES